LAKLPLPRWIRIEPEFVIVGTGRSGTGYISEVLTKAGIRTGHEGWWNPDGRRKSRLVGDASWLAVFQLDEYRGKVFHQVRDPIKVISSLASVDFATARREEPWAAYRSGYIGGLSDDPVSDAMRAVDVWIAKISGMAERTWRLEDVDERLLHEISARIGRSLNPRRVRRAMADVGSDVNSKVGRSKVTLELDWDDLPNGPLKDRVLIHAESFGYL
jgi:hypothetical protein